MFLMSQIRLLYKDIFTMDFVNCVQRSPFTIWYVSLLQRPRNNTVQLNKHQAHITGKAKRAQPWERHAPLWRSLHNLVDKTQTTTWDTGCPKSYTDEKVRVLWVPVFNIMLHNYEIYWRMRSWSSLFIIVSPASEMVPNTYWISAQ